MGKNRVLINLFKGLSSSVSALVLFCLPTASFAEETFQGAAFQISVPDGFEVEPSLQSNTNPGQYDSVKVHSQDGSVSFYVFAPRYGGIPADIVLRPAEEKLIEERGSDTDEYVHTWWTIGDRKLNYARSYHSRTHLGSSQIIVFGIEYKDTPSLKAHMDNYKAFKSSFQKLPES